MLKGVQLKELITKFANDKSTVLISAVTKQGLEYLERQLKRALEPAKESEEIFISFCDSKKHSWLVRNNIITEELILETGFQVRVFWSKEERALFYTI